MISKMVPHFINKLDNSVLHCSMWEKKSQIMKGTLKQAYPKLYQVNRKQVKRNIPRKKRFLLPLKFQSTLQVMAVSLTVQLHPAARLEIVKGLSAY